MIEPFIETLSSELELPAPVQKDAEEWYWIDLNALQRIGIKEHEGKILLQAKIDTCPTEKREEKFIHWMKANFLGVGTGWGAIGLDSEGKFLTLSRALDYEVNYALFQEALEQFANYLDYWQRACSQDVSS